MSHTVSCGAEDTQQEIVYVSQFRGDSFRLDVELTDAGGSPVDASGWTWLAQIRDATDAVVAEISVDTTDAAIGVLVLTAETGAMVVGDFDFDLEATDTTPETRTLLTGRLRLKDDVSSGVG